jgi:diguanylate cyclase (GGDEF)-like protein
LTSLNAIHKLSNAEARHGVPVAFEGTVTYYRKEFHSLFVQDGPVGVYVFASTNLKLAPGDRLRVMGTTRDSYHPIVVSNDITILSHGAEPTALPATFGQLIRGEDDSIRVTVHARLRAADPASPAKVADSDTTLQLIPDGGYIHATVLGDNMNTLSNLLDAEVEVTGVAGGEFDDKMQLTRIRLFVSSPENVTVLHRADSSPWSLPVTPMNHMLDGLHVDNLTQRIRVQGTITFYQPGSAVVLQNEAQSLWIMTTTSIPLRVGDSADATGIPDEHLGFQNLTHSEVHDTGIEKPIAPQPATWTQLAQSDNSPIGHHYDLVSIEGQVVMAAREANLDEYVLVADGHPFSAVLHHPILMDGQTPAAMKEIPVGARARVSGICMPQSSDPLSGPVAFDILMRTTDDIAVVARPSLLSIRNLTLALGLVFMVAFAAGARSWALERKLRQKTAALAARIESEAALERRRSAILEDISGNRPLEGILMQITQMLTAMLDDAPCWFEIADMPGMTDYRPAPESLHIARASIFAHTGEPLGTVFAGFRSGSLASTAETDALEVGARLATLAIESRRLYTDLLHRSEFDLLTDIHNRFSMEKHLDTQIGHALVSGTVFGLVYIDLDGFKQINDRFGHHAGDQYLQEAAIRMKNQLRPIDMLARLGGDEFAALIPEVNSRTDVEEIALRLEQCFDETFAVGGAHISGSTSVGVALYPMDGSSKDGLLQAADAAMYAAKHNKRKVREMLEATEDSGRN